MRTVGLKPTTIRLKWFALSCSTYWATSYVEKIFKTSQNIFFKVFLKCAYKCVLSFFFRTFILQQYFLALLHTNLINYNITFFRYVYDITVFNCNDFENIFLYNYPKGISFQLVGINWSLLSSPSYTYRHCSHLLARKLKVKLMC